MSEIQASAFIDMTEAITDSASRLAGAIGDRIRHQQTPVLVSMCGVRGVPSSFFNALLIELKDRFGDQGLENVRFQFDSDLQKSTYERARTSVCGTP